LASHERYPDVQEATGRKFELERAFELARSGRVGSMDELRTALKREGFTGRQLEGPSLRKELVSLIKAARMR
jgi:hypothetical protein